MTRRPSLLSDRKGDILSVVLLIASILMLLGIVYVVLGRKTAKVPLVEVDLLTFAPPRTGLVIDVSFDEFRQNEKWMAALKEVFPGEPEALKKSGMDPEMTLDDVSRLVYMLSPTDHSVTAVRLKPGHTITHARLMALEGASEARVGNKVYVKCRSNHHHLYDADTLILTEKDSTMRDLLGRGFVSTGLGEKMKLLYQDADPAAFRLVAEGDLTNFMIWYFRFDTRLHARLRGNLPDLVDGGLKGLSLSVGLKEDKLAIAAAIHHSDSEGAKRSEKDFDNILASWKPDLRQRFETLGLNPGSEKDSGETEAVVTPGLRKKLKVFQIEADADLVLIADLIRTVESSSKEKKLTLRAETSVRNAARVSLKGSRKDPDSAQPIPD